MPDFDSIPEEVARKAKFIIVSYPLNPVCTAADDFVYEELIRFADEHEFNHKEFKEAMKPFRKNKKEK